MKFAFHAEMGISGCSEDEVVEIPDVDLAGADREEVIRRYFEDWLSNVVSSGWEEVDDDS